MKIEIEIPEVFIDAAKEIGASEEELENFLINAIIDDVLDDHEYNINEFKQALQDELSQK